MVCSWNSFTRMRGAVLVWSTENIAGGVRGVSVLEFMYLVCATLCMPIHIICLGV